MEKVCQTGFRVFFMTSVLWQMVNLAKKRGKAVSPDSKGGRIQITRGAGLLISAVARQ